MTAEQSSSVMLARRFIEGVLGGQDPAAFDELVAENVWVSTGLKPGGPITSKAEYGQALGATIGTAFSHGALTVEELLAVAEDRVLVRFTASATHSGELYGIAPTGRRIDMAELHLMCFAHGKLVENFVGALNPLSYEMLFREYIAVQVL